MLGYNALRAEKWREALGPTQGLLTRARPLILANNVAEYYADKIWPNDDLAMTDLPCIAPPFPHFTVEFKLPGGEHRYLSIVTAFTPEEAMVLFDKEGMIDRLSKQDDKEPYQILLERTRQSRWVMGMIFIWYDPTKERINTAARAYLYVGENGQSLEWKPGHGGAITWSISAEAGEMRWVWMDQIRIVLLTISLMHCKNVIVESHVPATALAKKSIRQGGVAPVTYKTLVIEPMKKVLRHEGKDSEVGIPKALHICRGHFKTYSAEKPLFGKFEGTYFWQSHVRGHIERGVARKDYAVKAPREQRA